MAGSSSQRLKGILSITVLKANDLIKSDFIGDNDCYAVISLEPLANESKVKTGNQPKQTETRQKTQIRDGCNPIFNEKLLFPVAEGLEALYVQVWDSDIGKDDLLGYGTLSLLGAGQGGQFNTSLNKEWLHTVTISMDNEKRGNGGTLELVLHFIPESLAAYMSKKFNAAQADLKKKLTDQIVSKMTDVAADQIRGYVGISN
ncbi:unnamed protein product [Rotaria magnacalcarata]|uniref:C2 domain-containing protein n=1 Tax=Rotaria magnacalcarata TaxID=392030 RepID=A0A816WBB9_9BILA|nr:unnamed protein product [Rotaria magnacalcarata]CAF3910607.1 unnamed protein product [Rotaria magnacalcarata]